MSYVVKISQFKDVKSGLYFFLFRVSVEGSLTLLSYASDLDLKFERVCYEDKVILCSDWFRSLEQAKEKMKEIVDYLQSKGGKILIKNTIHEENMEF